MFAVDGRTLPQIQTVRNLAVWTEAVSATCAATVPNNSQIEMIEVIDR
jgi:hypothetical protein